MKRFIVILCSILCAMSVTYAADEYAYIEVHEYDIVVAGSVCSKDNPILSKRKIWLLPVRETCEKLGISAENIEWHPGSKTAVLEDNGSVIRVSVGESRALVNNKNVELQNPAVLHNGTLYLPLDFYEKAMECIAKWDDGNGIVYVQRLDEYNRIYKLLENCTVADAAKASKLSYEYESCVEMTDAENGYSINKQERKGRAEYNFRSGECSDEGMFSRLSREFSFKNHYKNATLYKTMFEETKKTTDTEKINEFKESVLDNAFMTRTGKKPKALPVVSAECYSSFSLSELEKLALVLKTTAVDGENVVLVSGSLLGIQNPLHGSGKIDEFVSYTIDSKSGSLLEINQKSITREIVYDIAVEIYAEWRCKYTVE